MIGTALGIAGSLISSQYNNGLAAENAAMAYNRQRSLMGLQQQYAVENWNREANYNSPIETMKRLREGDLNSNLVYNNGVQNLASPGISSPGSPGAPMAQVVPMSNPIAEAAGAAQALSLAKKAGSETIAQNIENEYLSKSLQDRINSVGIANDWTQQQIAQSSQQIAYIVGQMNVLRNNSEILKKELVNWDVLREKVLRQYDDEHNLRYQEYVRLRDTLDSFKKLCESNADKADWDAQLAELLFQNEKSFAATERSMGIVGKIAGLLIKMLK